MMDTLIFAEDTLFRIFYQVQGYFPIFNDGCLFHSHYFKGELLFPEFFLLKLLRKWQQST